MASVLACALVGWAGQASAVILVMAGDAPMSLQLAPPTTAGATPEGPLQALQATLDAAAADLTALSTADAGPASSQLFPWWPAVPPAGRHIEAVAGAAVAEPGTYALLAMGLLAVGAALFRQRPWRQAPGRSGRRSGSLNR